MPGAAGHAPHCCGLSLQALPAASQEFRITAGSSAAVAAKQCLSSAPGCCCSQGKFEEAKGEARGSVGEAGRQVERGMKDVKGRVEDAGDSLQGKD